MGSYTVQRLLQAIVVLLIVATATFTLVHAAPGGPGILLDPTLTPQDREKMAEGLGLDDPLPVQFGKWIGNVAQGDFGRSIMQKRPVMDLIAERIPATIELAGTGLFLAILIGIPLGVIAAQRVNSIWDRLIVLLATVGVAMPGFWFAIILIIVFSVQLDLLPSAGRFTIGDASFIDRVKHLIMPAAVIALFTLAQITYYTRSSMLEVMRSDYIRTARAKGLQERAVVSKHALKNGLIPIVTVIGLLIPRLVGGAVITETVFGWPGMGRLAADAAFQRDYPMIMGITIVVSVVVIVSNLLTDLAYSLIDPRIRLGE